MSTRSGWTRQQLLVAFALYCRLPFGQLHYRNPEIARIAFAIGRTPSALAMKLTNIASLDPAITATGRSRGLRGVSANDRAMWDEMQADWERFAVEAEQSIREAEAKEGPVDHPAPDDEIEDLTGVDRAVQTTTRIGQGFFRTAVLSAYNGPCCITGLSMAQLLIASHIIPWSQDRLNPNPPKGWGMADRISDEGRGDRAMGC